MDAVVKKVYENSIAEEIGIEPGDIIVSIDGQKLKDILDFKFLSASDEYEIEILKKDGTTEIIELVNEDYEEFKDFCIGISRLRTAFSIRRLCSA